MKFQSAVMSAVLAALVVSGGLRAQERYHEKTFNADTADKFREVSENLHAQMEVGGRYEYVKPDERRAVDQELLNIGKIFEENKSIAEMKEDAKVKLFNAQEVVNSILTKRDRDRVICKKEAPLGSHIPIVSCHTYAQEQEARRGTVRQLDEWHQAPCAVSGCVPPPKVNRSSGSNGR